MKSVRCRWCEWRTLLEFLDEEGHKHDGWKELGDHVWVQHPAEYAEVVSYAEAKNA